VATVIAKSSNVGATKIALSMPRAALWRVFDGVGFGRAPGTGFPAEAAGVLAPYMHWREIEHATLAFGYGVSVTPLQLAHAYSVLAGEGDLRPLSLLKIAAPGAGERVLRASTVHEVRRMLERVVSAEGTGAKAAVAGYRVAGKTGTVRKLAAGGYSEDRYAALFVGMVPASRPRLVMAVLIDEPHGQAYYGGDIAAPVFAAVMSEALRLMNVAPDALSDGVIKLAHMETH
jgi:cell division protein FtsI (penicillin-binding protein 3)